MDPKGQQKTCKHQQKGRRQNFQMRKGKGILRDNWERMNWCAAGGMDIGCSGSETPSCAVVPTPPDQKDFSEILIFTAQ